MITRAECNQLHLMRTLQRTQLMNNCNLSWLAVESPEVQCASLEYDGGIDCPLCRLLGKATFCAGRYDSSAQAYDQASDIQPEGLPAWKGKVELHTKTGDQTKLVEAYSKLVSPTQAMVGLCVCAPRQHSIQDSPGCRNAHKKHNSHLLSRI